DHVHGAADAVSKSIGEIGAVMTEVVGITGTVAEAVEAQSVATAQIAQNIEQAFTVVSEITSSIQTVTATARETETYAAATMTTSGHLASQSEVLAHQIRDYLDQVRKDLVEQNAA
ncbi:chemotaxis protein, partial [Rhodopseudomonas palustris]|nr:chemotaxis protein [Rhodopseudomonas palustris]